MLTSMNEVSEGKGNAKKTTNSCLGDRWSVVKKTRCTVAAERGLDPTQSPELEGGGLSAALLLKRVNKSYELGQMCEEPELRSAHGVQMAS